MNLVTNKTKTFNFKDIILNSKPELKKMFEQLEKEGILIEDFSGSINLEKLETIIFGMIFPGFEVVDTQSKAILDVGHPDFILRKGDREIYCEWKNENDSLRLDQIRWAFRNSDKEVILLWIEDKSLKPLFRISEEELRIYVKNKMESIVIKIKEAK